MKIGGSINEVDDEGRGAEPGDPGDMIARAILREFKEEE